ncbi:MAG: DUF533 domain-containing protein [Desulfocapsaceae bacterium]|nr:DUF533 domain-containing protein [Desulfocapsaceae bacterium]
MFNAEQLLGKMMTEMVGSGSGYKKHKKHNGGGMMRSLTSTLLSGKGLMTAIGLGVGAYEILKSQQGATPPSSHLVPPPPTSSPGYGASPVAAASVVPPPLPGTLVNPLQGKESSSVQEEELALRLIQVMIAAAHADGGLDSDEEGRILARLQGQRLSQEERGFVLTEMHAPKSIEQLVAGINDPRVAQTMYSLAVSAVVVDTAEERAWLDRLATALTISEGMRRFIEEEE